MENKTTQDLDQLKEFFKQHYPALYNAEATQNENIKLNEIHNKVFKDMCQIIKPAKKGKAKLSIADMHAIWALKFGTPPGKYIRLHVDGELMMSDTLMEKRTSAEFVKNAKGDVLIVGLGIGLVIIPLLEKSNVSSITVVEKYQDVIDIVLPQLKKHDPTKKLEVECADGFEYKTEKKFDTIFLDIWPYINKSIYKTEMAPLKKTYSEFLAPKGKIFVWCEYEAKNEISLKVF